ncbi:TIR domain-containing protein, partial [Dactylosporangium sp. NPDC005572]|uniref:TIR domain-containing protein n=1 Tax=Dactylosporangium sp. NPDC005572 TaxID=3156889 RepID=UPI0033A5BB08
MTGVFVNYRGMARSYAPMLVCTTLQRRFGPGLVFEAAHDNQPGVHFERSIEGWLERCSLLIACIDHAWIADQAKLRDPGDWVRREIEYCIEHDKPILPILLDGAEMPHRADLPAELGGLTRWIGLGMASTTVYADLERLVGRVEALAPELVLAALHQPPAGPVAPVGPAALLRAEHEVFPYRPQPELESLAAWAADPAGPPLRVVTGP